MKKNDYFHSKNYTGNHLHVDNFKDEFSPFIEGIAWERTDGTMDLFFDDLKEEEFQQLFVNKEHYYDKFKGGFIENVQTNEEAYEKFRQWVDEVLDPFRNGQK